MSDQKSGIGTSQAKAPAKEPKKKDEKKDEVLRWIFEFVESKHKGKRLEHYKLARIHSRNSQLGWTCQKSKPTSISGDLLELYRRPNMITLTGFMFSVTSTLLGYVGLFPSLGLLFYVCEEIALYVNR